MIVAWPVTSERRDEGRPVSQYAARKEGGGDKEKRPENNEWQQEAVASTSDVSAAIHDEIRLCRCWYVSVLVTLRHVYAFIPMYVDIAPERLFKPNSLIFFYVKRRFALLKDV